MKTPNGVVKVGKKSEEAYINASFYCLEKFGQAKVRGLGQNQGKVLKIAETLSEVNGIEIVSTNNIHVDGIGGIEILIEQEGGEDGSKED